MYNLRKLIIDIMNKKMSDKYSFQQIENLYDDLSDEFKNNIAQFIQLLNNDKNIFDLVFIGDILYICRAANQQCVIVTRMREYKHLISHEAVLKTVEQFNFIPVDNKVLVNMDQVKKYDSDLGKVYFDENITKASISIYMAKHATDIFKQFIGVENDLAKKPTKEKAIKGIGKSLINLM